MKTGIKTIESSDYMEIADEVQQLRWIMRELNVQAPTARIDHPESNPGSHVHKFWEWGRALRAIKEVTGSLNILDIGASYSLLGPALCYLGYNVYEAEPDIDCGRERVKLNMFLDRFNKRPIRWKQAAYGNLQERCVPFFDPDGQYDVVMSISTIEHVDLHLEVNAWEEMVNLLRPGGLLIVTMDCMPEARKGFMFDDVRWTNYDMNAVKERVDKLKGLDMVPVGEEDYAWHGALVHDYSFASIIMRKDSWPK